MPPGRGLDAAAVDRLCDRFAGQVLLSANRGYDAARAVWHGVIDRHPAIVVRPDGSTDVVHALRFAREQDLVSAKALWDDPTLDDACVAWGRATTSVLIPASRTRGT